VLALQSQQGAVQRLPPMSAMQEAENMLGDTESASFMHEFHFIIPVKA
jgi:hypothetical protein